MADSRVQEYNRLYGQLNKETREHSLSVALMCEKCAKGLDLDPDMSFKIGYLHDVGKIFIPSRILKKNMGLTSVERQVVDLHSYFGFRLLEEAGVPRAICVPVLYHHGFNKPKLSESEDPITEKLLRYVNLLHSVDVYDAMARTRVYHKGYNKDKIFKVLSEDPLCTERILRELNFVELPDEEMLKEYNLSEEEDL